MISEDSLWQLNVGCALHQSCLNPEKDHVIFYNQSSGQTHIISTLGVDVLCLLNKSPKKFAMLLELLTNRWELDADEKVENFVAYVSDTLKNLDQLGLIEPC